MILVHLHGPVTIDELKKIVKDIEHMVPEQMIRDASSNIHKKYKLKATNLSLFCKKKNSFKFFLRC